jgi:hypothetical protein
MPKVFIVRLPSFSTDDSSACDAIARGNSPSGGFLVTLVFNEIHLLDGLRRTMIVAAADRRITNTKDGSYYGDYPKLFDIPYLNGAISYFGLAWWTDEFRKQWNLWDVIPAFIRKQSATAPDLKTFAFNLRDELHRVIPGKLLGEQRSGFHICGYRPDGIPEFWFLTNIRKLEGYDVKELKPSFKAPAPQFLERDMRDHGWDGEHADSVQATGVMMYRNGDIRAHGILWKQLDEIFNHMWQFPDFRKPSGPEGEKDLTRFKFEVLGFLYKRWARHQLIGQEVDIRVWTGEVEPARIRAY